jgi:sugar/nucleoside kinase (ribokinase family)
MGVDLVCGAPVFLDITFPGLEALPAPGEERHADDLVVSPGGGAITAIGAARLGLDVAVAAPLGRDYAGRLVRTSLADEGIAWVGNEVERTATTVVLPADGDRAMVTFDPAEEVMAVQLAASEPRAAVVGLEQIELVPDEAYAYVATGDADSQRAAARLPSGLAGVRALLTNEREALMLSGRADAAAAAWALAEHAPCVIVTQGAEGALAVADGELVRAPGRPVDPVDTTGAGDLFAAAYVWADLAGLSLPDRLAWAVLYAALSVGVPTAVAGAKNLAALVAAAAELDLAVPAGRLSGSREDGER